LVRPFLLIPLLCAFAYGQTLEEAVRQIAKNVLAPGEVSHVSERPLDPQFAAETTRARTLLDRVLARPAIRDARLVEVVVTATENNSGPLLVLQIKKGDEQFVKTAAYSIQPAKPAAKPSLTLSLLREQPDPILDLAIAGDRMLVLSPTQVEELQRAADGKWDATDAFSLEALLPSRDPRGKLEISNDTATAFLPGGTCAGKWTPSFQWTCTNTPGGFQIDGEQIHFTPGQNTVETAAGNRIFSLAGIGDVRVMAEVDGSVRVSKGDQPLSVPDWGSDIASLTSRCLPNPAILSTSSTAQESVTAYDIASSPPRALTEPLSVPGPVTALWPTPAGALAVVHESQTGQYAAYLVSLDCGN
jgi:hypothetical protein